MNKLSTTRSYALESYYRPTSVRPYPNRSCHFNVALSLRHPVFGTPQLVTVASRSHPILSPALARRRRRSAAYARCFA